MYIGVALLKDGFSVGEINTLPQTVKGKGEIHYDLDATQLNNGLYEIGVALFTVKNREEVGIGKSRPKFVIKGSDDTRGGALKLPATWN